MKETTSNRSRCSGTAGHTGSRPTSFGERGEHSGEPVFVPTRSRLFARRLPSFRAFSLLSLIFGLQTRAQENAPSTGEIEDWVARQIWVANIESGLPAGVNLTISSVSDPGENDSEWQSFQLRTVHGEGSGFDPNVSPSLGIFRVDADRTMVEWLEPVSGEWDSLSAFLRSMKPQSTIKPDTAPMPGRIAPEKNAKDELSADLDGDGKAETVRWKKFDEVDGERFFHLEVIDDNGTVLWTGPKERTFKNAYVFFESHFGISLPQLLHDIDGDGALELLGPEPQSDVSPTYFRRLTWREGAFFPRSSAALMMDDPEGKKLTWREGDYSHGTWVLRFGPVTPEGLVQVQITDYGESEKWRGGAALIRFRRGGATIEQWIQPLSAGN